MDVESDKQFVRDLRDKQTVNTLFLAKDKAVLVGKNGKTYVSLSLTDASGAVDARVWDNVEAVGNAFESGDIVRVKGVVQLFQNRRQIVVHKLEKADASEVRLADFLSASRRDPQEMLAQLVSVAESMSDTRIRQLTLDCLNDPEVRPRLLTAPAAKSIHHAYVGGLLEHVLSICGVMKALAAHYSTGGVSLNLDYLLFGAIFHDLGKIWELEVDGGIAYTDKGKLLGHMVLSVELIERKASRILGFPDETKDLLKHIVLSHHGKLEYGSPKTPMFLEAFVVAAIDDLDSKIACIDQFIRSESASGERWSRYNTLFERHFFLKVPQST
jgi:3'-5' exoribonuclease